MKLLLVLFAMSAVGCTSDLRPEVLKISAPDAERQKRGRQLLSRTAQFHGIAAAKTAQSLEFVMTDQWKGLFANVVCPWPSKRTHARVALRLGSFDARVTFLDGEYKDHVWGLQAWKTYEIKPGGAAKFVENEKAAFVLPAEQYLVELAFRVQDAELIAYAGQATVEKKTYDLVFVTWGSFETNATHDQYLLYLDPETGRLEKGLFTVREKMKSFTSAVHFTDYQTVDGMLVPHTITLNDAVDDGLDDFLHQIKIEPGSTQTGVSLDRFFVNPDLKAVDDRKVN